MKFLQAVVDGIDTGSVYALLALSVALIYKTMGTVNFATGTMGALSAFILYSIAQSAGVPWIAAVPLALLGTALMGAGVERGIVRPLGDGTLFRVVLATMGLDILLNSGTQKVFGNNVRSLNLPLPQRNVSVVSLEFSAQRLVIVGVVLVLTAALALFLQRTNYGVALRAFAQDRMAASLMGIPAPMVSRWTWVIAVVLGGVAGIFVAAVFVLSVGFMAPSFLQGVTAAVLGGLASLPGAVAGGFTLGIVEALCSTYAPSSVTALLPLLVIVVVLLIRPSGLFGRASASRA